MYDDLRATAEAPRAAECLRTTLGPYGIEIAAAFALPKILHTAIAQPAVFHNCCRVIHQTDWIVGMLCGRYDVTDISTALKSGAVPAHSPGPRLSSRDLGLPRDRFPEIVLPGTPVGEVTPLAAAATGLPAGTAVVAGCTDGTAGFLASGASASGDMNVTLGTTLVLKAVAARPLVDPAGAVYNHRHPGGGYLPGAASSTGGGWTSEHFGKADLDQLGSQAAALLPTGRLVYPLLRTGERFPLHARGPRFRAGGDGWAHRAFRGRHGRDGDGRAARNRAVRIVGARRGPHRLRDRRRGGGATWLRIRAAVMRRTYAVPRQPEFAVGAAVLVAAAYLGDFARAAQGLVRIGQRVEPDSRLAAAYDEQFLKFRAELQRRGYL